MDDRVRASCGRTDPAEWRDAAPIAYTSHITDNAGGADDQVDSGRARTPVRSTAPKAARLAVTVGSGAVVSGENPRDGFPAGPPRPAGTAQEAPVVTAVEAVATARSCSCNSAPAARGPSLDRRPSTQASSPRRAPETSSSDSIERRPPEPITKSQNPNKTRFYWESRDQKMSENVQKRLVAAETAGSPAGRKIP